MERAITHAGGGDGDEGQQHWYTAPSDDEGTLYTTAGKGVSEDFIPYERSRQYFEDLQKGRTHEPILRRPAAPPRVPPAIHTPRARALTSAVRTIANDMGILANIQRAADVHLMNDTRFAHLISGVPGTESSPARATADALAARGAYLWHWISVEHMPISHVLQDEVARYLRDVDDAVATHFDEHTAVYAAEGGGVVHVLEAMRQHVVNTGAQAAMGVADAYGMIRSGDDV